MTYQVVASHRTGSSLLNHYAIDHNDGFGFHELFLKQANTKIQSLRFASTEQKFEFLESHKKQDTHFSIKIFPCSPWDYDQEQPTEEAYVAADTNIFIRRSMVWSPRRPRRCPRRRSIPYRMLEMRLAPQQNISGRAHP